MVPAELQQHLVTSVEALERLYEQPYGPSIAKETDRITPHYRAFIEAAPFFALASGGPEGFDCSPRGDAPGFVRVQDEKTLLVPDRRGNNRIDTLRNIINDPRVALLFLIPGCGETIRVNGSAAISTDPALARTFVMNGKAPRDGHHRRGRSRLLPVLQGDRAVEAVGPDPGTSTARACPAPARSSTRSPTGSTTARRTTSTRPSGSRRRSTERSPRQPVRAPAGRSPAPSRSVQAARACAREPARSPGSDRASCTAEPRPRGRAVAAPGRRCAARSRRSHRRRSASPWRRNAPAAGASARSAARAPAR